MSEVIQEFVAQALSLMGARNKACDVEELDRNRSSPIDAAAVVWFASIGELVSSASTVYLQVADGALGVDCGEAVA
jgi:hypothetical protein